MAIGDLLYEKVIDFSTNPSIPYTPFGSGLSVAYEVASKTLQASAGLAGCGVVFSGEPVAGGSDISVELTMTMTADSSARKHMGIWLINATGTMPTGYRLVGLDGYINISRFDNATETGLTSLANPNGGLEVGRSYRVKVTKTGNILRMYIDDIQVNETTDGNYTNVRPGLFLYGCTVQLSKVVYRRLVSILDEIEIKPPIRLTAVPANQEPREQYLPNVAWSGSPPMWQGPVPTLAVTYTPANTEPREVFQPQDVVWRGSPGFVVSGPVPDLPVADPMVLCKGSDNYWLRPASFNAGADLRNVEQGFIESTVTISGQGVRRRVLCFTQEGELVGETYSRAADGVYRFDLLWLNKRYMLVAQDDPAFGPADYNAVAADFQAPKPYPKGTGVPTPLLATKPMKKGT
ncbi:hypothetical protein ACET8U_06790 [Aeromonas veronii]